MDQPAGSPDLPTVEGLKKALRRRRWRRRGLLAAVVLAGLGTFLAWGRWDRWPTQATIRSDRDAWPLAFTPDGRLFATADTGAVTLWDSETGARRQVIALSVGGGGGGAVFSPDGRTLAVQLVALPGPSSIGLVDVASGQLRATLPTPCVGVYDLAFIEDGKQVRALLADYPRVKLLRTWDAATGAEVADVPVVGVTQGDDLAMSPDGKTLALVPIGGSAIELRDLASGATRARLGDPAAGVAFARGLRFAPDGRTLAVGRQDGSIELWDVAAGQIRRRLAGHSGGFQSGGIRFAPDGRSLASHGNLFQRNPVRLVFAALGSLLGGGRRIQQEDETIAVDLATGATVARASSAIHPMYSPDGRWVATRQHDLSARIRPNPIPPR